jgi:hypothetical protein
MGGGSLDLRSTEIQSISINLTGSKKYNDLAQGPYSLVLVADNVTSAQSLVSLDSLLRLSDDPVGKIRSSIVIQDSTIVPSDSHLWVTFYDDVVGWEIGCFWLPYSLDPAHSLVQVKVEQISKEMLNLLVNPRVIVKLGRNSGK